MKNILLLLSIVLIASCCLNKAKVRYAKFKDLPQPVCDTLINLRNLTLDGSNINDEHYPSGPEMIDLSGGYSIEYKFWHSWLMKTTISNSSKKYVTDEHLPNPIVIFNDILYIPTEFNIIVCGFDEETSFKIVEF